MAANIFKALAYGFSADTILSELVKKYPQYSEPITKARKYGFLAPTILKKLIEPDKDPSDAQEYFTEHAKTVENDKRVTREGLKTLAKGAGAIALGGYGLSRLASQGVASAVQATAQSPNVTGSPLGRQSLQAQLSQQNQPPTSPVNPSPSPSSPIAPSVFNKSDMGQQFPQLNQFIEKHVSSGKSAEETIDAIKKSRLLSPVAHKIEQQHGMPISDVVKGFYDKGIKSTYIPKPNQTVMAPMGAGDVKKIHGNDAYVEINNKLHKVPLQDLQEPDEDVISAVSNILKIPEIDRSSNVALFLYDPSESKAIFQFHDGSAYKYLDMDPETVRKISEKEATPITEGKNEYGAWSPDDPHGSLGAALWAYILKDPKYAKPKKGEPANPNYLKLDTEYDYWKGLRKKKKRK